MTDKQIVLYIKHELNTFDSLKYINNCDNYRNYVDSYIDKNNNCLCLNIEFYNKIINISNITINHKLFVNYCMNLININNLKLLIKLKIYSCKKLINIYDLESLNKLDVGQCDNLTNIYNLKKPVKPGFYKINDSR